jgi:hypothetical protein
MFMAISVGSWPVAACRNEFHSPGVRVGTRTENADRLKIAQQLEVTGGLMIRPAPVKEV